VLGDAALVVVGELGGLVQRVGEFLGEVEHWTWSVVSVRGLGRYSGPNNYRPVPFFQRASQLSVKFYRRLRSAMHIPGPWDQSVARLKALYDLF